ncbi:beta-1,3-galactosyltransferase 2-like [Rhinophrynus dorsalis]
MCEDQSPYLLLLIPSMPQDAHIREVLRKTWANESLITGISIKRIFLLGRDLENVTQKDLEKESFTFHDIIQQDFLDTYYNLTVKTMMGLEWASRLCPNASYVMKIDTDMFFNPWFLVNQVLQPNSPAKSGFFTGLLVTGSVPLRDKGSKWYMPFSVFSKSQYPPYCSGTGYVFSGDLSARIYNEGRQLPIIPYEDVFVGMCLNRMGLQITRPAGNWFIGEKLTYNRCKFAEIVTVHHFQPDELLKYWPDFLTAVESCT